MKKCVESGVIARDENRRPVKFEKRVEFAREAGFDGFDLGLNCTFFDDENWRKELDRRIRLTEKAGMKIYYLHLPFDYPAEGDETGWERFRKASLESIDALAYSGALCAAIHPRAGMKTDYDREEEYRNAVTFLEPFANYAAKKGVKLGLENMRGAGMRAPAGVRRFCTDVDDLIRVADEVGLGICWDTGHGNISMQDQKKSLLKIGKRLTHIHVNDNFAEDDVHLAPFLGNVNWQGFIEGLAGIGYKGEMNLEVGCGYMPEVMRSSYGRLLSDAADRLIGMLREERR